VGRYPAAILRELLSLEYFTDANEYISLRFTDSTDSPTLRAWWNAVPFELVLFQVAPVK